MAPTFGQENPQLTQAIKRVARISDNVAFTVHAEEEMDKDGFDHADVLTCLRKGRAHGPERQGSPPRTRSNVVHRGLHIRVVVGGLDECGGDWDALASITVITAMKVD